MIAMDTHNILFICGGAFDGIDKKIGNPRAYTVLEEVGVKPNVFYLTKIRNKEEAKA